MPSMTPPLPRTFLGTSVPTETLTRCLPRTLLRSNSSKEPPRTLLRRVLLHDPLGVHPMFLFRSPFGNHFVIVSMILSLFLIVPLAQQNLQQGEKNTYKKCIPKSPKSSPNSWVQNQGKPKYHQLLSNCRKVPCARSRSLEPLLPLPSAKQHTKLYSAEPFTNNKLNLEFLLRMFCSKPAR